VFVAFCAHNLVVQFDQVAEGGGGGYAEDQEEALTEAHVHVSVWKIRELGKLVIPDHFEYTSWPLD
jgi:hypothetical protein